MTAPAGNLASRPQRTGLIRLLARALALVWSSGRGVTTQLVGLTVAQAAATVAQLAVAGRLVADVQRMTVGSAEFSDAVPEIVALGVLTAVQGAASIWLAETRTVLGELTVRHAQDEITTVATTAPLIDFDRPEFHDLLTRALRSGSTRPLQVASSFATIASSLVLCVALAVTLVVLEPLVLVVLVLGGVPAWLLVRFATRLGYRFSVDETEPDRRRSYLLYLLTSREPAGELRAFGLADHVGQRHDALWSGRIARLRAVAFRRGLAGSSSRVANAVAISLIIALLVWNVAEQRTGLAAAATAAGAVAVLGQRLSALLSGVGVLYECALFLADVDEFAARHAPAGHVPSGARRSFDTLGPGGLRAVDVSFTYPTGDRPALDTVSIDVAPGEVIALVGANGSGKTTLAKVLAGLFRPENGEVTWAGHPVTAGDSSWHDDVAVVFQDFCRYRLPLRDNVTFGRIDRLDADDDVRRVLDEVGLGALPARLANGLDTGLGPEYDAGTDLSGGQWQRVAIARALFRDAPVVILDEPSAALDPDAESQLFDAIGELSAGRAVVVVSHRLATVTSADRIYVLDGGTVVESGPHAALIAADGEYARMFRLQARRFTTHEP